jgi:hypothetical protein
VAGVEVVAGVGPDGSEVAAHAANTVIEARIVIL